ncbi:hypothetical protein SEA_PAULODIABOLI_236 [Microbacterium phage PauloDiaboli]|nr:hypothetical protein SEA_PAULODIABOLI_236 [Microbacterium phage PauloDiaboli]
MGLSTNILLVVQRIAAEFKSVRSDMASGSTAIQGEIDALSDVVATKASEANVNNQLAQKANASDLDNVFGIATGAAATAATKVTGLNGVTGLWKGTQAQYDGITTKDPNVYYVVLP